MEGGKHASAASGGARETGTGTWALAVVAPRPAASLHGQRQRRRGTRQSHAVNGSDVVACERHVEGAAVEAKGWWQASMRKTIAGDLVMAWREKAWEEADNRCREGHRTRHTLVARTRGGEAATVNLGFSDKKLS